jgi:ribosomal protein S18 acetylase RimI-like enzyme
MIKHEVQLVDYKASEHGGYVLRMLGELYDSQVRLFRQGAGVLVSDPIADIESHIVDIITYNDERCGIILSTPSRCFEETCGISDIILEEGYRRKGIARKALTMVISRAMADGAKFISLNVHSDNLPALRLYESMGFKEQSKWMVLDPLRAQAEAAEIHESAGQSVTEPCEFREGVEKFEKKWLPEEEEEDDA